MKTKNTKKRFVLSLVVTVLSIAMLIGSTFAWFTDSVTSGKNKIIAGNLDVDLVMDKTGTGAYESIANQEAAIFGKEGSLVAQNDSTDTLWEPGKTQIVYLGVQNKGSLALKYNILIDVKDEGLVGALEYALIDGAKADDLKNATKWTDITGCVGVVVNDVVAGRTKAAEDGVLDEIANGITDETDYFALAVHMKEDADNTYQGKSISIDVTVMATQVEAENDSFGNTYDKDATIPTLAGNNPPLADYIDALGTEGAKIPEVLAVVNPTILTPMSPDPVTGAERYEPNLKGVKTTIDLQNELKVDNQGWNFAALRITNGSEVTFKGNENGKFVSDTNEVVALIYVEGPELKVNIAGGIFETNTAIFSTGFSTEPKGEINISGGIFKFTGADKEHIVPLVASYPKAPAFFRVSSMNSVEGFKAAWPNLNVNITGGTFYNCDPTGFVAEGHSVSSQVVENDMIYTVK